MDHHHDIIAIGGSAGSIDVIREICRGLPAGLSASVFVVVHIGEDGNNLLARIFGTDSELPATTAVDGEAVERGHIYVAPAGQHLIVLSDTIRLGRGPRENRTRPAIDPLFRSVAVSYGPRVIGLVLSGYLNDGAVGLVAIKRCGGITIVQNPADADVSAMPLGALHACDIDYRASAADLSDLLAELVQQPADETSVEVPGDLLLEVDIALGRPNEEAIDRLGKPSTLTCPSCNGVLSQMKQGPLRFRCQVGHSFTAEALAAEQEGAADEAIRVASRIIRERLHLIEKMATDTRRAGLHAAADRYDERAGEYRTQIEALERFAPSVVAAKSAPSASLVPEQ